MLRRAAGREALRIVREADIIGLFEFVEVEKYERRGERERESDFSRSRPPEIS